MKNFIFLLLVALFTIVVLVLMTNPGMLEEIWLWLVGLSGTIIGGVKSGVSGIQSWFKKEGPELENDQAASTTRGVSKTTAPAGEQQIDNKNSIAQKKEIERLNGLLAKYQSTKTSIKDDFEGITLTVLRFEHDATTTLGLLYYNNDFYCYTLEDTYREEKKIGHTRIPQGTYPMEFLKTDSPLTKTYQERYPDFFTYHLEIKNIPNFSGVYLHVGNTNKDTKGCLLVADGINSASDMITSSVKAFTRLYQTLSEELNNGQKVRIKLHDEHWFASVDLQNLTIK